jgi:hypothetical protein
LPLLLSAACAAEMPAIHPGHPRMAFAPATARQDAARLTRSPFWKPFSERAATQLDSQSEQPGGLADAICNGGLLALATNDRAAGEKVGRAIERLARVVQDGRWQVRDDQAQGSALTRIAFGYDWAYLFLTPEQRRTGADVLMKLAAYSRATFPGYFREGSFTAFNNHTHQNQVAVGAAGFAAAGEHPEAQKLAEYSYDMFTRVFLPVFERFVGANGMWNEGTHYNQVAFKPTFIWMAAAGPALGKDFFRASWVRASAYYWVYLTRSDDTMTILGDWFFDRRPDTIANLMSRTFWVTSRAASAHRDPHLQAFVNRQLRFALQKPPEVWNLLWYDPDLKERPVAELPPSRLFRADTTIGGGETLAVMRSGWGADARLLTLSMGDWLGHHDHYDSNAFTIHYKDDLAIDPGYGGEGDITWIHYRRTSAHNSLLVPVPEEQAVKDEPRLRENGWGYDGGQRVPLVRNRPRTIAQFQEMRNPEYPESSLFETGECLAFETRAAYDYVAGDATRAYNRSQLTRFVRHMVFVKPDIVILYDVVETPAGRQPRWLLQTVRRPTEQGGLLVARNGGELRVRTLLPAGATTMIQQIPGMGRFNGQADDTPFFRTEITAPAGTEHRFLHVMQITDEGSAQAVTSRWERDGEWLRVELETPAGKRQVSFRWEGKPGVRYRS